MDKDSRDENGKGPICVACGIDIETNAGVLATASLLRMGKIWWWYVYTKHFCKDWVHREIKTAIEYVYTKNTNCYKYIYIYILYMYTQKI